LLEGYRGHLVLITIVILVVAVSNSGVLTRFRRPDSEQEPSLPPSTASQAGENPVSLAPTPAANNDAATDEAAGFNIAELPIRSDMALSPAPIPVTYKPKKPQHELITYTVQSGDTAIGIAERFGIKEETILGGNPSLRNDASQLWAGTDITILPVDGVLHDVVEGDTVESLAEVYDVPVADIINYEPNNLEFPYRLSTGTQILVPGAVAEVWIWDPPSLVASADNSSPEALQGIQIAVPGTGTFIRPWSGGRITQNPWYGHMAIDIGLITGSPVYASDTGTVTYATWSPYCYGNLVVINHGNGFETFYAHLSDFNVSPGQTVYQGDLIAWTGNTGCSSGPHLHFEIRYFKERENPWTYLP
jgi:murein DD-endopeptidase MepM/ murein hydrolase activator NlpD